MLALAVALRLVAGLHMTQRRYTWKPPRGLHTSLLVNLVTTVAALCGFVYVVRLVTNSVIVMYCGYVATG